MIGDVSVPSIKWHMCWFWVYRQCLHNSVRKIGVFGVITLNGMQFVRAKHETIDLYARCAHSCQFDGL